MSGPQSDPAGIAALLADGIALAAAGAFERARPVLTEAATRAPAEVAPWFNLGVLALKCDDPEGALAPLARAAALAPGSAEVRCAEAEALYRLGRVSEAITCWQAALALDPERPATLQPLAAALAESARLSEALTLQRRLADLCPQDAEVAAGLARMLGDRQDWRASAASWARARALGLAGAEIVAAHALAVMRAHGPTAALAILEPAAAAGTASPFLLHRLGQARREAGDDPGAAAAFRAAIAADPADSLGVAHDLALLTGELPTASPPAWIARVFDVFAPLFDDHLDSLGYAVPEAMAAVAAADPAFAPRRLLDLGCGTGLCALAVTARLAAAGRAGALAIDGVDLSPQMLARAAERRREGGRPLYDRLTCADVAAVAAAEPSAYDLMLAGDVLIYIADPGPLLAAAAHGLAPGGRLLLSTERATEGEGAAAIRPSHRFAHADDFITECARAAGLTVTAVSSLGLRREANDMIAGSLFVLTRG